MAKKKQKKKKKMPEQVQRPKDFLDMIAPAAVKFNTDHFILGSRYHTAMALKSYPPMTDELALLRGLGDMGGVNLRLTARQVTPTEEDAILHAATNKSRMERNNTNDYKQRVTAEANLRDMAELLAKQRQEKEPLIHCGVYLDIAAADTEKLRTARDTVSAQLVRSRMGADPLLLRQREGFLSANPAGGSQLANFAERVLPARSVANLYPMNYSGKTDPKGFFIGRDRFGSNIIVDFDRRASDKTNASALILGNTGQGKSYLLKLLLCNVREAGKSVISLDSEHEMEDECRALGGCFLDYLSGQYRINLLEPRCWDDGSGPEDPDAPDAFRGTLLSQHISFLRDVFRVYKGFDTPHIDTLELMVERLYQKWNITDRTDFAGMQPTDYPILSDLYDAIQESYDHYDGADSLYPREMLRDLLLGLHSMCRGADARFFNGHTNIDRSKFLVFCVKGLDNMAENLRNTLLFSLLSYMSDQLLTLGNSVAAIDELYLMRQRHIDREVISYFAHEKLLYEDTHHNCVFVGLDGSGEAKHAHIRSTNSEGRVFRMNIESSASEHCFHKDGTDKSLYVFEAPIDLLSHITLYPYGWQEHSYVACCGTSIHPVLERLRQNPKLDTVYLCLDNDDAGNDASDRMTDTLEDMGLEVQRLCPVRKDWNDDLRAKFEKKENQP